MSIVATVALAYAGFTALCLAMERQHRLVFGAPRTARRTAWLRVLGAVLLALSAVAAATAHEGATGIVAWLGCLTAAALPLVFLLPYAPRAAVALGAAAPAIALAAALTA